MYEMHGSKRNALMNMGGVEAVEVSSPVEISRRRPLPRRGAVKSRIFSEICDCIFSTLSRSYSDAKKPALPVGNCERIAVVTVETYEMDGSKGNALLNRGGVKVAKVSSPVKSSRRRPLPRRGDVKSRIFSEIRDCICSPLSRSYSDAKKPGDGQCLVRYCISQAGNGISRPRNRVPTLDSLFRSLLYPQKCLSLLLGHSQGSSRIRDRKIYPETFS